MSTTSSPSVNSVSSCSKAPVFSAEEITKWRRRFPILIVADDTYVRRFALAVEEALNFNQGEPSHQEETNAR